MDKSLQVQFDKLEASKRRMLQQIAAWPAEQRMRKPSAEMWSATQVIDHIAKVEGGILQAVRGNMRAPHAIGREDRIGNFIVRCVLRSPMRVKMPQEATGIVPADNIGTDAALAAWDAARAGWLKMLERAPAAVIHQGVFAHPRGGWMSLPDTVSFLRLHHDHHRAQLQRIKKALG